MSTITETVDVSVPVSTAYNQWTQFEQFPQFMEGVTEVRQLDDTHLHWCVKVGGATREFDATITQQVPDQRIAWRSDRGPDHAGVVQFDKVDAGTTRVTAEMTIDPEGFLENVGDKLGLLDRRVKGDLERFKDYVERQGRETGAWRGQVGSESGSQYQPMPGSTQSTTQPTSGSSSPMPGSTQPGSTPSSMPGWTPGSTPSGSAPGSTGSPGSTPLPPQTDGPSRTDGF